MKNETIELVVVKGSRVFIYESDRKLVANRNPTVEALSAGTPTDFKELKKEYPHATLRMYSDSRLANKFKSAVDKAEKDFLP